jgi:choline dehydrogenase-like flavoprotein
VAPRTGASFQVALHYSSGVAGGNDDMLLMPTSVPVNRQLLAGASLVERARILGKTIASAPPSKVLEHVRRGWDHNVCVLLQDGENRGTIRLASADPDTDPVIEHHYLADEVDRVKLREGVQLTTSLLRSSSYRDAGVKNVRPLL